MTNVLLWRVMLITGEAACMWGQGACRIPCSSRSVMQQASNGSRKIQSVKKNYWGFPPGGSGFPGGSVVKNLLPMKEQLSPGVTVTETTCCTYSLCSTREATAMRSSHTTVQSSPHSP